MTSEIAKAEWKPIKELKHLGFTKTTQKICQLIMQDSKNGQISKSKLEECGLTFEDFKMRGTENKFYSAMNLMKKKAKL